MKTDLSFLDDIPGVFDVGDTVERAILTRIRDIRSRVDYLDKRMVELDEEVTSCLSSRDHCISELEQLAGGHRTFVENRS